jgi:acyl carrier protein
MGEDNHSDAVADVFRTAMHLDDGFAIADWMSFDDIPGWDSVGHMHLVMELESHFGVSLYMDESVGLDRVAAVRALLVRGKGLCPD